jgi:hypothetical protein
MAVSGFSDLEVGVSIVTAQHNKSSVINKSVKTTLSEKQTEQTFATATTTFDITSSEKTYPPDTNNSIDFKELVQQNESDDTKEKAPVMPPNILTNQQLISLQDDYNKSYSLPETKAMVKNSYSYALAWGNTNSTNSYSQTNLGTSFPTEDHGDLENPTTGEPIPNQPEKNVTEPVDVKYDIPIAISFAVRKHLTDAWAIESGLTYTYLSSTETYITSESSQKIKLHYVGIPIKLVYSFVNTKNLSIYAGAGGMGEVCVGGKLIDSKSSHELDISALQWSVFGSVGLNYRFLGHLGLFIEPGVVYYFDDGSDVNTIRKEQPLNINFQIGFRLNY